MMHRPLGISRSGLVQDAMAASIGRLPARVGTAWGWLLRAPGAGAAVAIGAAGWAFVAVQLAFFAVNQPIYSPVDEFNHFFYIQYLYYRHHPPVHGLAYQATTDPSAPPELTIPPSRGLGIPTGRFQASTEGVQPPGYYALMAPIFGLTVRETYDQIIAIRLATAGLASLLVRLTFLLARVVVPTSPFVSAGASWLTTLSRGYNYNLAQITNDSLAVVVAGLAIFVFLWLARAHLDWRWGASAGLTTGVAIATKSTIYFIPLVLLATFLARVYRERFPRSALSAAGVGLLVASLFAIPWFALHYHRYRGLTPPTDWPTVPQVVLQYHNLPLIQTFHFIVETGAFKFW